MNVKLCERENRMVRWRTNEYRDTKRGRTRRFSQMKKKKKKKKKKEKKKKKCTP